VAIGRDERLSAIIASILPDNTDMQKLCLKLGFELHQSLEEGVVQARLLLAPEPGSGVRS
jgi:acetyltransferase